MCNCSSAPVSICDQCSQGQTCCCPPDYSIMPQPTPCGCCPDGYNWSGPTPNWPDGVCTAIDGKRQIAPIPCNACAETIASDCVIIPAIACLGFSGGTLTAFITFMCSDVYIESILEKIGLSSNLGSGFCQLVQNCPPPGSGTTPIIGTITVTFP